MSETEEAIGHGVDVVNDDEDEVETNSEEVSVQSSDTEEEEENGRRRGKVRTREEYEKEEEVEIEGAEGRDPMDVFQCFACKNVDSDHAMLVHYGCKLQVFCGKCREADMRKIALLKGATPEQEMVTRCGMCNADVSPRTIQWCPDMQARYYRATGKKCPLCEQVQPFNDIQQHIEECVVVGNRPYTDKAKKVVDSHKAHTKKISKYRQLLCGYLRAQEELEDREKKQKDLLKARQQAQRQEKIAAAAAAAPSLYSQASSSFSTFSTFSKRRPRKPPVDFSNVLNGSFWDEPSC